MHWPMHDVAGICICGGAVTMVAVAHPVGVIVTNGGERSKPPGKRQSAAPAG